MSKWTRGEEKCQAKRIANLLQMKMNTTRKPNVWQIKEFEKNKNKNMNEVNGKKSVFEIPCDDDETECITHLPNKRIIYSRLKINSTTTNDRNESQSEKRHKATEHGKKCEERRVRATQNKRSKNERYDNSHSHTTQQSEWNKIHNISVNAHVRSVFFFHSVLILSIEHNTFN